MTSMIVRVGIVATSTKPVTKVPTSAPAVEMPLRRPTIPPVFAEVDGAAASPPSV